MHSPSLHLLRSQRSTFCLSSPFLYGAAVKHALLIATALLFGCERGRGQTINSVSGPVIGHVDTTSARIWVRPPSTACSFTVTGANSKERTVERSDANGSSVFHAKDLQPGSTYRYRLACGTAGTTERTFRTAPSGLRHQVRLVFGSCANDERFAKQPVWKTIKSHDPDAMVILGDTPYIDSTDLAVQRKRYREFFAISDTRSVFGGTPTWATWDDHDFGKNDTDGHVPGKERSRQAFVEHHAHASFGDGKSGIYTSFRWGPVEIWLLDARWWANTDPSPVDPSKKTLLGAAQWRWVTEGLECSDATFKVLASGMIWNGSVRPLKRDHWAHWKHERDALWRFIGDKGITGVVLVAGDIHRSRALRHPSISPKGYPLTELITSPLANTVITTAKVPHPGLLHDAADQHTFLLITIDGTRDDPTLLAEVRNHADTVLFSVRLKASELRSHSTTQ